MHTGRELYTSRLSTGTVPAKSSHIPSSLAIVLGHSPHPPDCLQGPPIQSPPLDVLSLFSYRWEAPTVAPVITCPHRPSSIMMEPQGASRGRRVCQRFCPRLTQPIMCPGIVSLCPHLVEPRAFLQDVALG